MLSAVGFALTAILGWSAPQVYKIDGMHCDACAKGLDKTVCGQMAPELSTCKVELGKITVEPKADTTLNIEKVKSLVEKSGKFTMNTTAEKL